LRIAGKLLLNLDKKRGKGKKKKKKSDELPWLKKRVPINLI
jgi:hypothetical protein